MAEKKDGPIDFYSRAPFVPREVEESETIACPVCGEQYVHIASVRVNQGGNIAEVTRKGVDRSIGAPSGRGSCVTIAMWCEFGHTFVRDTQFRKGETYFTDRRGPDWTEDEGPPGELWRD